MEVKVYMNQPFRFGMGMAAAILACVAVDRASAQPAASRSQQRRPQLGSRRRTGDDRKPRRLDYSRLALPKAGAGRDAGRDPGT